MERAVASEFAPTAFCRRARHRRSNREPCVHDLASDGSIVERHQVSGLVTALDPVLRVTSGTWIAHGSGTADRGTADAFDRVQIAGDGEVFRFYRTADACHVNSLDDGMNPMRRPCANQLRPRPARSSEDLDGNAMKNTIYALLVSALAAAPATRNAAELRSSALAKQLVTLMAEQGLGTVAARDPDSPDRFVAAMAFPEVQLLVVAAQYPAATLIQDQIASKRFTDIYAELQAAPMKESKLFFQDIGCDGIGGPGENVDVMYEHEKDQTLFDGDWKRARLSKTAYDEKLSTADGQYSRLLEILIAGLKAS
jgi:hypothetical protein